MARPLPRRERRAAWRNANRARPTDPLTPRRVPRAAWAAEPVRPPVVAMALAKRRSVRQQDLHLASLGFNRPMRLALRSKKGSRSLTAHGRPTATPAESFRTGPKWNRPALLIEYRRRAAARAERYRRENGPLKRLGRFLRWWLWLMPVGWLRSLVSRLKGRGCR